MADSPTQIHDQSLNFGHEQIQNTPSLAWLIRSQRLTAGLIINRAEKALFNLESEIKKAHQTIKQQQNLNTQQHFIQLLVQIGPI